MIIIIIDLLFFVIIEKQMHSRKLVILKMVFIFF